MDDAPLDPATLDESAPIIPAALPEVPDGMARVQIITDLMPWATVDGVCRPWPITSVIVVPRQEAEILKAHYHAVESR